MAIQFPEKPDVPLKNNPLIEVVCQVRIPPILRISKEMPVDFQEEIRHEFPNLETEQGFLFRIPKPGVDKKPEIAADNLVNRFKSIDNKTSVSLAVDFYALSTQRYTHWREFLRQLQRLDGAVQKIYTPPYANRIGLRFINRLTPENTGLQTLSEICGLLHADLTVLNRSKVWESTREMETRILLADGNGKLNLRTGYGTSQDDIPYFLLDFDYFEEGQLNLSNLVERCTAYHDVIYRAFRWCIPDEKLNVFNPGAEEQK